MTMFENPTLELNLTIKFKLLSQIWKKYPVTAGIKLTMISICNNLAQMLNFPNKNIQVATIESTVGCKKNHLMVFWSISGRMTAVPAPRVLLYISHKVQINSTISKALRCLALNSSFNFT